MFAWAKSPWKAWVLLVALPMIGAAPLAFFGMWFEAAVLMVPAVSAVTIETAVQVARQRKGLPPLQNRPVAAVLPRKWTRVLAETAIAGVLVVLLLVWALGGPMRNATTTRGRIQQGMSEAEVIGHAVGRVIVIKPDRNQLRLIFLSPLGSPARSGLLITFDDDGRVVGVDGPRAWSD